MGIWTREQLEERVDDLHREYRGPDFAEAVERFSREELDREGREQLGEVLLERAGKQARSNPELRKRIYEGGWFRRTFRRLEQRSDR